jgi:hypothetical protein
MPNRPDTFQSVITDAINDLAENGFDSADRVMYWQDRIRAAAEAGMVSTHRMEELLRGAMAQVYHRMVDRGGLARMHPGVERFTADRLRPALRAELDRRIMASAQLIKLNRKAAIDKTLQRFSGWATSVPKGGSDTVSRRAEKKTLRKALTQLPFEERRVLIDQGHKLQASINEVVARGGAALAVRWHSHWRQAGYDYRVEHRERDGLVYLLRGTWAVGDGLVRPGPAGWYEDVTAFAEEPFCRCYGTYIYALRDLPEDMVTKRGREAMAEAKAKVAAFAAGGV